jgi:hypothetical protein
VWSVCVCVCGRFELYAAPILLAGLKCKMAIRDIYHIPLSDLKTSPLLQVISNPRYNTASRRWYEISAVQLGAAVEQASFGVTPDLAAYTRSRLMTEKLT